MAEFLGVDVGGTKCEVGLFSLGDKSCLPVLKKRYRCSEYGSLEEIVSLFLEDSSSRKPELIALGVAGPIEDGVVYVTNLPWTISEEGLKKRFSFRDVLLINDLTAVCASISVIGDEDKICLHPARPEKGGMIGVVAPGTGLGEGYLLENDALFLPCGSEGGHSDFGPTNGEQLELLRWMQEKRSPVSYEDLIAGPGVPNLFDFLVEVKKLVPDGKVIEEMRKVSDRTQVIFQNGTGENRCSVCGRSVDLFLEILGAELGNQAITLYATGGMYIGGGILPRITGKLDFSRLVSAYLNKGKMENLVRSMPLYMINRGDAALIGVARCANHRWARA